MNTSRKSLTRWLLAIFVWLPLAFATGNMVVSSNGVCISQMRYWTDDELIEVAVRELAHTRYQSYKPMAVADSEASIQEFLKNNPQCCEVDRYPSYRGMLDLLVGWNVPEIEVNYERDARRPATETNRFYKQFVAVNTCGEVMKTGRGIDSATLETTKYTRK